ncbi:Spc7 domain-containing protein [Trichoderma longibrachiatum]|uniref:Spc7-domain-containing protein n=1 Tax=Trichoderma longibrachiatum ATCC 18648 TaxID=983965 RepID=A0A2T4BW12_TRILO|nr:Spc7-domain-containing protein [Trichoderma longibrachiatum ATCC 18648]
MPPPGESTMPTPRRLRKSIGVHTELSNPHKENATLDVGQSLAASRKSRSKSIGPGGLDALRQGNGNRRASLAAPTKIPRSILKPTISLPEIPPLKSKAQRKSAGASTRSQPEDEPSGSKIAVRTEEEQQAAAREREERERRDARRKSLANRRVSFAAEATLHTFHEVEYMQSRNATESRRKSGSGLNTRSAAGQTPAEDESTQGKRSSLGGQSNIQGQDDNGTSVIYSSDSEPADAVEEIPTDEEEAEEENSNSDSDDGTMMSLETEELTGTTVASEKSLGDLEDSSTLDEALRMAARRAATQQLGDDSDDGEEIIPSFGWARKPIPQPAASGNKEPAKTPVDQRFDNTTEMDMDMDMDITQAMGKIIKPSGPGNAEGEPEPEAEVSMDVTRAFGGIISGEKPNDAPSESGEMEDATMEFTTVVGGIHYPGLPGADTDYDANEDMSMELTSVMGGLLASRQQEQNGAARRQTLNQTAKLGDDATMDMTAAIGQILPGGNQHLANDEDEHGNADAEGDETMGMDITTAIGGIIKNTSQALRKSLLGSRSEMSENPRRSTSAAASIQPPEQSTPLAKTASQAVQARAAQVATTPQAAKGPLIDFSTTPQTPKFSTTPKAPSTLKTSTTPNTSKTPNTSTTPKTPASKASAIPRLAPSSSKTQTPTSQSRTLRSASRKAPSQSVSRTPSPVKTTPKSSTKSTQRDVSTPRRLSGVGADRPGLGSPQVAAIFDRRESLTDSTSAFVAGKRAVAFSDPKVLAQELDQESDEGRKSGGRDATINLREMIDSMSPKRNPLKGRKSLHIGSARGLLGKRPAELDEEAEAEENDGVKRLKGRQGSPVKNVKLQQPPSKEETTGRLRRSTRLSFDFAGKTSQSAQSSPLKGSDSATLLSQKFSRAGKENQTVHDVQIHQPLANNDPQVLETIEEHQMHLQDFLNLTSIRFMELNTTKRRHTIAPRTSQSGILPDGEDDRSLERCVVAGACTVPMLELYQHSCRELKKYISEGRRIVKEIETETFEENPPLFREYLSATPDVKALMDNQFKNVRTHARHLSKAMWYEWRMKLQDGLNEGLVSISDGMKDDLKIIEEQEKLLKSVMPQLVSRYESLLEESSSLEEAAKEIADCDPAELQAAREELTSLDDDIAQKKKLIAKLRQEFDASAADVEELTARKTQCLAEIKESERVREECRGWTSTEVNNLKARVEAIEKEHGWAVTGISGSTLSMTYKREIELVLDITSFQPKQPNSPIDLWYIADSRAVHPLPRTLEKDFLLQCIREHIRAMPQNRTKLSHLLSVVKTAWDKSNWISREVGRINVTFPTKVTKTSDSSIAVTSSLLLAPLETRIEVIFNLKGSSGPEGVNVDVSADARVVYGEQFNVGKVGEFLGTRIGKRVGAEGEPWSDVVVELYEKLIARGKKQ